MRMNINSVIGYSKCTQMKRNREKSIPPIVESSNFSIFIITNFEINLYNSTCFPIFNYNKLQDKFNKSDETSNFPIFHYHKGNTSEMA